MPTKADQDWMNFLQSKFAEDGYRVPQLLRRIVTSEAFYRILPAAPENSRQADANGSIHNGNADSKEKHS